MSMSYKKFLVEYANRCINEDESTSNDDQSEMTKFIMRNLDSSSQLFGLEKYVANKFHPYVGEDGITNLIYVSKLIPSNAKQIKRLGQNSFKDYHPLSVFMWQIQYNSRSAQAMLRVYIGDGAGVQTFRGFENIEISLSSTIYYVMRKCNDDCEKFFKDNKLIDRKVDDTISMPMADKTYNNFATAKLL